MSSSSKDILEADFRSLEAAKEAFRAARTAWASGGYHQADEHIRRAYANLGEISRAKAYTRRGEKSKLALPSLVLLISAATVLTGGIVWVVGESVRTGTLILSLIGLVALLAPVLVLIIQLLDYLRKRRRDAADEKRFDAFSTHRHHVRTKHRLEALQRDLENWESVLAARRTTWLRPPPSETGEITGHNPTGWATDDLAPGPASNQGVHRNTGNLGTPRGRGKKS